MNPMKLFLKMEFWKKKTAVNSGLAPLWVLGYFGKLIPKIKFVYICDVPWLNATTASQATGRWSDKLYTAIAPVNSNGSLNFTSPLGTAPSANSAINRGSLELPSYGLMDAGFSYKMLVGKEKNKSVDFRFNMNNVLDEVYIAEGKTNTFTGMTRAEFATGTSGDNAYNTYIAQGEYDGVHQSNQVFFGFGRTWNFTIRYNF